MNPAIAAHIRLLESTPRERIHTHHRAFIERRQGVRVGTVPQYLIDDTIRLMAAKKTRKEILDELGIGERLYYRIARIIRGFDGSDR